MNEEFDRPYRLFFAYGPHMESGYLKARSVKAEPIAVACLKGHRIEFYGHSPVWDGAIETVVADPSQDVWGVVYKMSYSDAMELDSYQDVRLDGAGPYFHFPARVTGADGQAYFALLYKKNLLEGPACPSAEYMDVIIKGASENGLSVDYINKLKKIETVKASYPVPLDTQMVRRQGCSGCDDLLDPLKDKSA